MAIVICCAGARLIRMDPLPTGLLEKRIFSQTRVHAVASRDAQSGTSRAAFDG
jgi:hypothetical protein